MNNILKKYFSNNPENIENEKVENAINKVKSDVNRITDVWLNWLIKLYPEIYDFIKTNRSHNSVAKIICENFESEKVEEILKNKRVDSNIKLEILEFASQKNILKIDENFLRELESNLFFKQKIENLDFIYSAHYNKSFVLFEGKSQIIDWKIYDFDKEKNLYLSSNQEKFDKNWNKK